MLSYNNAIVPLVFQPPPYFNLDPFNNNELVFDIDGSNITNTNIYTGTYTDHTGRILKLESTDYSIVYDAMELFKNNQIQLTQGLTPQTHITYNAPNPTYTLPPARLTVMDEHVLLHINNKSYSGSGSVIIVIDDNNESYIVLFKSKTGFYQETGGRLDRQLIERHINTSYVGLYENAKKKTYNESARLFELKTTSLIESDIITEHNNTLYKVYVYKCRVGNISDLKNIFNRNMKELANSSFYDTDSVDISFVNINTMKDKCSALPQNITYNIQVSDYENNIITCRNRTINVLRQVLLPHIIIGSVATNIPISLPPFITFQL